MCQCEILLLLKLLAKFGVKFTPAVLSDEELLAKFQSIAPNVKELRQFKKESKTPICVVKFEKESPVKELFIKLLEFREFFKLLVVVDMQNYLENPYMGV